MKNHLLVVWLSLLVFIVTQIGCGSSTISTNSTNTSVATTNPSPAVTESAKSAESEQSAKLASIPCDDSLLQHVYNPQRLIVKTTCITVTGTIMDATAPQKKHQPDGVRHEGDGDSHGWLKVDPQFANLLNGKYER